MKPALGLVAAIIVALGVATPAAAQTVEDVNSSLDMLYGDHEAFGYNFEALQMAVRDGDAATVAMMASYPLRVSTNGEEYEIDSEETFVENYDALITPAIADVILSQDFGQLFVNSDGVMFGSGEVWFQNLCLDDACESTVWAITAIQEVN